MPRLGRCVCGLLLLSIASGCGDSLPAPTSDEKPVYVTGSVKYRGHPLAGGQIVFVADPDYGAGTDLLAAAIGYDGSFVLHDVHHSGLKPGYYRITLSTSNRYLQLPRRYADPNASGLRCQVDADQPLRLSIELDDPEPAAPLTDTRRSISNNLPIRQ